MNGESSKRWLLEALRVQAGPPRGLGHPPDSLEPVAAESRRQTWKVPGRGADCGCWLFASFWGRRRSAPTLRGGRGKRAPRVVRTWCGSLPSAVVKVWGRPKELGSAIWTPDLVPWPPESLMHHGARPAQHLVGVVLGNAPLLEVLRPAQESVAVVGRRGGQGEPSRVGLLEKG